MMNLTVSALAQESVWFDKYKFGDAEQQYYEGLQKLQWIKSCSEAVESPPMPPPQTATKPKANANKNVKEEHEKQEKKAPQEIIEKIISKEENVENLNPEKKDAEKEADVKKPSKKSKKNKNKKNQPPAEGKTDAQPNVAAPKPAPPGNGKKASHPKGEAPNKEVSQGDNKKSESKKSEKKEAKKDTLTGAVGMDINARLQKLEEENAHLKKIFGELKAASSTLLCLTSRVEQLEKICITGPTKCPAKTTTPTKPAQTKEDDDVDLFGSDEEDDPEKERIKAERLKMYEEKKSKKPTVVAKSNIILDVKPWDDETDMKEMEVKVRQISCQGLLWGASKLVPLAYGIHKLQISCVIEDELVSVDWLQEQIESIEDLVQSVDIAAFNKV